MLKASGYGFQPYSFNLQAAIRFPFDIAEFRQENIRFYRKEAGLYDLLQLKEDFFCAVYTGSSWPTSSNIYIIMDADGLALIDAGTANPDCHAGLEAGLKGIGRTIGDIHTILLTHGHPDHVGGANAICNRARARILLPELCLPEAIDAEKQDFYCLPPDVRAIAPKMRHFDLIDNFHRTCGLWELDVDRITPVRDGEEIRLGRYVFQALHTSGHDIGLMCFYESAFHIICTGDLLRSTGPGSALPWYTSTAGGVERYLESLDRIRGLDVRITLPAHGSLEGIFQKMVDDTREVIDSREAKILSLLREGPRTCEQLDAELYRPVVLGLCPWFSTVTESHLSKLKREGSVECSDLKYRLR